MARSVKKLHPELYDLIFNSLIKYYLWAYEDGDYVRASRDAEYDMNRSCKTEAQFLMFAWLHSYMSEGVFDEYTSTSDYKFYCDIVTDREIKKNKEKVLKVIKRTYTNYLKGKKIKAER